MSTKLKTIILNGEETEVIIPGCNCDIRNDSTAVVYASAFSAIAEGADGVASIPAGGSMKLLDTNGRVYLKGVGSVVICGNDNKEQVFKSAAATGGSSEDAVARAAINIHADNTEIHVTAEEKASWNAVNYSNPNMLINPDFMINQRGQSHYEGTSYSVDRWRGYYGDEKVNVTQDGITVEVINNQQLCTFIDTPVSAGTALCAAIRWRLDGAYSSVSITGINENGYELIASANNNSAEEVTTICAGVAQSDYSSLLFAFGGDGTVKPYWAKLELGSAATPFFPPDPAAELMKCQRYYQLRSTGDIAAVDLRPVMHAAPSVTQLSDGNYAYSAELR